MQFSSISPKPSGHPDHRRKAVVARAQRNNAVVILPGLGNNAEDYLELKDQLTNQYKYNVEIADVSRLDWCVVL
jgi:hypothetical protein